MDDPARPAHGSVPVRDERGRAVVRGAVVALVGLALALRVRGLATRSLWLDEAWLANLAFAPSWQVFWERLAGWPVPALFTAAVRCVALAAGRSEAALRGLPLVASVACVPLAYEVGRRVHGPVAGLVAAACMALGPVPVAYGQELKQYSTDALVCLTLLLAVEHVACRPDASVGWAVLAVLEALAPGLSYPAALLLPGVALGALTVCRTRHALRSWLLAQTSAGVGAAVWYVAIIRLQRNLPLVAAYWQGGFAPAGLVPVARWLGARSTDLMAYAVAPPGWLVLALTVAGYALLPRRLVVVAAVTAAVTVAAAVARVYPLAADRTSLYLLPLLALPLGALLATLSVPRVSSSSLRALARVSAVAMVVLLALPVRASLRRHAGLIVEDTRPLVQQLATERRPGDRVYVYYGAVPAFLFYAPTVGLDPAGDSGIALGGSHRDDKTAYEAELRPLLVPGERLWLLFAHVATARDRASEQDSILGDASLYARVVTSRETEGASLHLMEVTRAPGTVRHLRLDPKDLQDPERLRELLR